MVPLPYSQNTAGPELPSKVLAVISTANQPETAAQLLVQVAGRAGRADLPGTLLLQTCHPDHPLFRSVLSAGYEAYARTLLAEREAAALPPFGQLAVVRAEASDGKLPAAVLREAAALAPLDAGVMVYGPMPSPMERRAGRYRQQLMLLSL